MTEWTALRCGEYEVQCLDEDIYSRSRGTRSRVLRVSADLKGLVDGELSTLLRNECIPCCFHWGAGESERTLLKSCPSIDLRKVGTRRVVPQNGVPVNVEHRQLVACSVLCRGCEENPDIGLGDERKEKSELNTQKEGESTLGVCGKRVALEPLAVNCKLPVRRRVYTVPIRKKDSPVRELGAKKESGILLCMGFVQMGIHSNSLV